MTAQPLHRTRVLFLIHDLGGGGAEKVLVNLVNNLDTNRYEVFLVSLFGGGANEGRLCDNVQYRCVWQKPFPGNSRILRRLPATLLHALCIKERVDIEVAYLEDVCAKIIAGGKESNAKHLCWVHTDLQNEAVSARGFRNFKESARYFGRFNSIVCVSSTVERSFLKLYPNVQNTVVCYNTLETDEIIAKSLEPVEDLPLRDDEVKLVGVGKICELKGFDRMARIVKRLRQGGLPVHFYALGTGPDQPKLEAWLKDNGMSDFYTFLGYQSNPYKYMAKCDLYICASTREGFSTAATEALVVGTPVCTVEVSGMKEMLGEHNEWGMVTKNDDDALYEGIRELLNDPKLLAHYKRRAIERGKTFSTEKTVRAVENLLREV